MMDYGSKIKGKVRAMTREDNDLTIAYMAGYEQAKEDFKTRTCENCKWLREILEDGKGYGSEWVSCSEVYAETNNYSPKDFGCLKFERKDK